MSNKVLIVGEKYSDLASTICDSMGYDFLVYGSEADNIGEVRDTDLLMLESYYPEYDRIVFTYDNGEKRASSILEMQKCLERGCKYRFNTPFLRHMDTINISPDAEIGEGCVIGAYVSIQAGSKIGIGTVIEEGTVIGANCVIGEGCTIGSDCLIEGGCKIGALILESYYRQHFWNPMLRYNRLCLYLPQMDLEDPDDNQPRIHAVKWDLDAIASLSHYLSKRTVIGEYRVETLRKGDADGKAESQNFICIGDGLTPLHKQSLASYIYKEIGEEKSGWKNGYNIIHQAKRVEVQCDKSDVTEKDTIRYYKGFIRLNDNKALFTQHPSATCANCSARLKKTSNGNAPVPHLNVTESETKEKKKDKSDVINFYTCLNGMDKEPCSLKCGNTHYQLAKLLLWRDFSEEQGRTLYRVEINGSSGPATHGLSTLFVDDQQKEQTYTEAKEWKEHYFLCELQKTIREKLMEVYLRELEKELKGITLMLADKDNPKKEAEEDQRDRYYSLVKHAISLYLSTVLYRYFFPFLSDEDIERICNSAENYVIAMSEARVSPFAKGSPSKFDPQYHSAIADDNVAKAAEKVITVLRSVLTRFRGVEAFFQIKVKVDATENPGKQDTRKLENIEALDQQLCSVSCLFAKGETDSQKVKSQ